MDIEVPLLQTYVDGLDRALGGGIPRGSTVLVAGTPGTMKTSLILWMMHENARLNGVKSLYVSLEQDMDSLEALYALSEIKTPRREMFHFLSSIKELGLTTFLIAEQPFGSTRLAQWGEDFLADGILNLRQVEVGETDVQLRLRCIKMRWMNHDHNALALNHDGQKFFVTHVISKKK